MDIADRRDDVVAITAAMPGSTGLIPFQQRYPERFFDTGIAEQHALTSAAGMARAGRFGTKGLAISFVSTEDDATVMNQVQERFEVSIEELPEEIDQSVLKADE